MEKKTLLTAAFISILLFSVAFGMLLADFAKANFTPLPELPPPIYIRNDGNIEPSSAPIERVGDTYKLTGNIYDAIEVERDNIVLDGNGFTLTKPPVNTDQLMTPIGWLPSIRVSGRKNVTIKNAVFNRCYTGITVKGSSNITVTENTFNYAAAHGIVFWNCHDSTIIGNTMLGNKVAISFLENADHIEIKYNKISGSGWHAIWGGVSNSKIIGNNIVGNGGIALYNIGSLNWIIGNNFENNDRGILCYQANNLIHHNNFINNRDGQFHCTEPNTFDDGDEGNFWSDYNGTDLNGDGVGDIPYIVETPWTWVEPTTNTSVTYGINAQDNYPLMYPFEVSRTSVEMLDWGSPSPASGPLPGPSPTPSPVPTPKPIPTSTPSPTTVPSSTQEPTSKPELPEFSSWIILPLLITILIGMALLVHFKKHKR